jgi:hypothetical protein
MVARWEVRRHLVGCPHVFIGWRLAKAARGYGVSEDRGGRLGALRVGMHQFEQSAALVEKGL